MESEGLLVNSQKPIISPYRKPGEFRPYCALYLPNVNVNILLHPTRWPVKWSL